MMIACHTGYQAGCFTHVVANEQIYDRHIDTANEMLKRFEELEREESDETLVKNKIKGTPMLSINPNKTNFYDFTIEDFEMLGYDPIKPQLKLELGI